MNRQKIFLWLSILFFLILNWGAILLARQNRSLPPEPDDAGVFLTFIQANRKYPTVFSQELKIFNRPWQWNEYGGFDRTTYFSWALFWGKFGKIFLLSPETTLLVSFLLGVGLFLAATLYFFKEENLVFKSLLIFTLAFFTGDGAYQGFFWPGPSLFAVSLFFLVLKIILTDNREWFIKLPILTPILLTLHPLSVIGVASLFIFACLSTLFKTKNKLLFKKLVVFLTLCLSFNLVWFNLLAGLKINLLTNTNILKTVILNFLEGKFSISSTVFKVIFAKYFLYLATRPFFLILFVLGIISIFQKNKTLLLLLNSFYILLIPAVFFPGGERVLLYVWLLTFFVFAYGIKFLFDYFKNNIKNTTSLTEKMIKLMFINFGLGLFFTLFIFKTASRKDLILKQFFYLSCAITLILLIRQILCKKRLILVLAATGLVSFFIYLSLEKIAMIVFQQKKDNLVFEPKIFLTKIEAFKKGPIIYNDNLSFALFSNSGLLEREVIKRGFLQENDLNDASYFIALKSKFKDCQEERCWLQERGIKKRMERKAMDNNFLLYEF